MRQGGALSASVRQCATLLLLAVTTCLACRKATPPPAPAAAVATLSQADGQVQTEHTGRWEKASPGISLYVGDAVRTGPLSTARLRFLKGGEIVLAERSLLRLATDADSSVHVSIELGEAQIEGTTAVLVATGRGPARLEPGTQLRVKVDDQGARYEVIVGRAVVGTGGEAIELAEGDGLALRMGNAQMERYRIDVGTAQVERQPSGGQQPGTGSATSAETPSALPEEDPPASGTARGTQADRIAGPVDVSVPAGESAILHGPQTPVAVRLHLPEPCSAQAMLHIESAGRRRKQPLPGPQPGTPSAARLTLAPGAHRYRIECPGSRPLTGRLDVRRDSGNSRLVRRAPLNMIETDGRRYTVLYQNRLPALTLKWPGAPRAQSYTLNVSGPGEDKQYPTTTAELHLGSGALGEGAHTLWFTADGSERQSQRTAVTIRFDNAAVAAEIDQPRHGARVEPDAQVDVAGVALQGSTVAVGGAPLTIDQHGRFRGQVPRPAPDERSIAIRFSHPKGGVHYYIRRLEME